MEPDSSNVKRPPRRRRSIVFFDHGEPSFFERKIPEAETKSNRNFGSEGKYIRVIRLVVQAIAVWLAILTIGGIVLRSTSFFCKYTPWSPAFCSSPLIKSQNPLLNKYTPGQTPTTNLLQKFTKLNEISPSLQTLGLVMSLVSANLSTTYSELYTHSDVFKTTKDDLETLAMATRHTQEMVEQFSHDEYFYRQSEFLWGPNGIYTLGIGLNTIQETLSNSSTAGLMFSEHALHRVPYGARWSLESNVVDEYFYFVGEQQLAVKEMIFQAAETGFILGDTLGFFGRLERSLEHVVEERGRICGNEKKSDREEKLCSLDQPRQLRTVTDMRQSVQWIQDVVLVAEKHYKDLLSELSSTGTALRADMTGYRSMWPAKGALSLERLNETLTTERTQLEAYAQTVQKAEEVVEGFSNEVLGEEEEVTMPRKLTEAIAKRELVWW